MSGEESGLAEPIFTEIETIPFTYWIIVGALGVVIVLQITVLIVVLLGKSKKRNFREQRNVSTQCDEESGVNVRTSETTDRYNIIR